MNTKVTISLLCLESILTCTGCRAPRIGAVARDPADAAGRTYYIDGAGNWGCGVREIETGLHKAGYQGRVINFTWSPTLNPALDQTLGRPTARARGKDLADEISTYVAEYPNVDVNLIGWSAGTGVAVWACENLKPQARIRNLILLESSLSCTYDLHRAMEHVNGRAYVYHSPHDAILGIAVRLLGTIDGHTDVDSAGLFGMKPALDLAARICNIGWRRDHEKLGWYGGHSDWSSEAFVEAELAQYIVPAPKAVEPTAVQTVAQLPKPAGSAEPAIH